MTDSEKQKVQELYNAVAIQLESSFYHFVGDHWKEIYGPIDGLEDFRRRFRNLEKEWGLNPDRGQQQYLDYINGGKQEDEAICKQIELNGY